MAMVKVWNDSDHDHKELFKGEEVKIPAKSFIEMELFEAHDFKGQYFPVFLDAGGQQTEESKKRIRIERLDESAKEENPMLHLCNVCKHKSPSPEELAAHIKVRHADLETLSLPDVDSKIQSKRGKKSA